MREERMRITQQFAMGCEVSGMWFSTYLERVTAFLTWPSLWLRACRTFWN
jgi:hypothetical protein